ncbi:ribonuclease H-like domain-containing protein [Bisporella sp. PMI_857]|nr:ribonuclease H-like domain-containing protein [Bisporella sp. PMI_857]
MLPWQPDSPIELENGQPVCKAHKQIICGWCCVDYSFFEDVNEANAVDSETDVGYKTIEPATNTAESEDGEEKELRDPYAQPQGSSDVALVVPAIDAFTPASSTITPSDLFPCVHLLNRQFPRFVHHGNPSCFLIYTDGACRNNGNLSPTAGWGFVFRPPEPSSPEIGCVWGRLEDHGPSGEPHPQTSNRAELRAVIAALEFRSWGGEGWTRLVIATDSEYVVKGATEWVRRWGQNGWITSQKTAVKNQDLWKELLSKVGQSREDGLEICFWRIPRATNKAADKAAKAGAEKEQLKDFQQTIGILV